MQTISYTKTMFILDLVTGTETWFYRIIIIQEEILEMNTRIEAQFFAYSKGGLTLSLE